MPKWGAWLAIAGLVLYNNWLLAVLLNQHATLAGATTSELGVQGQPWANLFRLLDILAGICFLLSIGFVASIARTNWQRIALGVGMFILAASTIDESILRLSCSSALSHSCAIKEAANAVDWQHSFHIAESCLSYLAMLLLPLGAYWAVRGIAKAQRLRRWSLILLCFMLAWFAESAVRYLMHADAYGYEQRLFLIVFSVWLWTVISYASSRKAPRKQARLIR